MRRDSSFKSGVIALLVAAAWFGVGGARGQDAPAVSGPDPNEIPVPEIATSLGTMPGVAEFPIRKELPDVLVMEDGTRVATRGAVGEAAGGDQAVLEYYAVGSMPPAPGNVTGHEVSSQTRARWSGEVSARAVDVWAGGEARA